MNKMIFLILISLIIFTNSTPIHRRILNAIEQKPINEQFKLWHYALKRSFDIDSLEGLKRFEIFKTNVNAYKDLK